MRNYKTRSKFWANLYAALAATFCLLLMAFAGHLGAGLILFTFVALCMNSLRPQPGMCRTVTLSVPEILMDVLDAFKLQTPELFGPNGFATDFSSNTARLGDKVTAKIAHVPVVGSYSPAKGVGFYNASQDVTTLIEDVPVVLNQFPIVTIKIGWLTQLSSKIPLYKEALRNIGWTLGKNVVDAALGQIVGNFSNRLTGAVQNINLDTIDGAIRSQLNKQKVYDQGRYLIVGTDAASQIGGDDRVRSNLFYGELNGNHGYRLWQNLAGFGWVREYPDLPTAGNMLAFAGDRRAICVASRRIDFSNVADQLGVPKVMEFYPMEDTESGVFMTGVTWQEVGTGDVYLAAGLLFGVGAGNQATEGGAGTAGSITDNAGLIIASA